MSARILVYGYGNPGRRDDGLGPALARLVSERAIAAVTVESAYQLQIEDALLVSEHDVVVFADAHRSCAEPFILQLLTPRLGITFSTHSIAPETVLGLAREHFDCGTTGFVLGIRGYEFDDFGEGLSPQAQNNLVATADALHRWLQDGSLVAGAQHGQSDEIERCCHG